MSAPSQTGPVLVTLLPAMSGIIADYTAQREAVTQARADLDTARAAARDATARIRAADTEMHRLAGQIILEALR